MGSRFSVRTCLLSCALLISLGTAAYCDWSFREDFNGSFGNNWTSDTTGIPYRINDYMWGMNYAGSPAGSFQTVDGASCYRMTNQLSDLTYVAWESQAVLQGTTGHIEARINTLTQDTHHLDGLFQMTLVSTDNRFQYASIGLWGDLASTYRLATFGVNTSNGGYQMGAGSSPVYANDTWYRLTLDATPDEIIFSVWNDTKTQLLGRRSSTEIQSASIPKQLSGLGSGFRVMIGQTLGIPQQHYDGTGVFPPPYYTDVAVDWVSASAVPEVPEPSSILALLTGLAGIGRLAVRRRK